MKKIYLVPVVYWNPEEDTPMGYWPEIIKVEAENPHFALLQTREILIEREKENFPEYPVEDLHIWHSDPEYSTPGGEGYVMGDPITLSVSLHTEEIRH